MKIKANSIKKQPQKRSGCRDGWFDGRGIDLLKKAVMERLPRWQKYIADGVISPAEKRQQYRIVLRKLKKLEPKVPNNIYDELTDVLLEYEILMNMHVYRHGMEGKTPRAKR